MDLLVKLLCLRRTKDQKSNVTGNAIVSLPNRSVEEHLIKLTQEEKEVYDKVFSFSQQAMLNYMAKHAKEGDDQAYMSHVQKHGHGRDFKFRPEEAMEDNRSKDSSDNGVMGSTMGQHKDVKAHHILVLLLRLRQVSC